MGAYRGGIKKHSPNPKYVEVVDTQNDPLQMMLSLLIFE